MRELMEPLGVDLSFEHLTNVFEHDDLDAYRDEFQRNFGPLVMARQALADQWDEIDAELEALFEEANQAEGGAMRTEGAYLQTIARKPG